MKRTTRQETGPEWQGVASNRTGAALGGPSQATILLTALQVFHDTSLGKERRMMPALAVDKQCHFSNVLVNIRID